MRRMNKTPTLQIELEDTNKWLGLSMNLRTLGQFAGLAIFFSLFFQITYQLNPVGRTPEVGDVTCVLPHGIKVMIVAAADENYHGVSTSGAGVDFLRGHMTECD